MTDAVELKDAIRTQDADSNVRISQSNNKPFNLCSVTIYRGENEQGQWLANLVEQDEVFSAPNRRRILRY